MPVDMEDQFAQVDQENCADGDDATDTPPDAETVALRVAALAKLSDVEYDQQRDQAAKDLNIRVGTLDREVVKKRAEDVPGDEATGSTFSDLEPWPEAVDGAATLQEVSATLRRFCILPALSAEAMALWVMHAHAHDATQISPLLAVVSPEKRCGKTTVLSVLSALVPKPMHTVNTTPAVLFRVIEKHKPTVLVDEGDTFLADNDDLRGIINGGHNKLTATVWRCVGDDHEPRQFTVWAPKAIAMIGRPPDTIEDRSVMVPLRRKTNGETVERFRADKTKQFISLQRKLVRFASDSKDAIAKQDPEVPPILSDRAADNWRPLIAIAEVAGGDWPAISREAAVVTTATASEGEVESAGVMLLRDCEEILRNKDRIKSGDLLDDLLAMPESPWLSWNRGRPISCKRIADLLKPYGISNSKIEGQRVYRRADFEDAWDRYLAPLPSTPPKSAPCAPNGSKDTKNQRDSPGHNDDIVVPRGTFNVPRGTSAPQSASPQGTEIIQENGVRGTWGTSTGVSGDDNLREEHWT